MDNAITYLIFIFSIALLIAMAINTPLSALLGAAIGGGFWLLGRLL